MRERPILFSAPMVRAILDGRKTQTRRAVKFPARFGTPSHYLGHRDGREHVFAATDTWGGQLDCPYGQTGDRLWVKETHSIFQTHGQHRKDDERWGPWGGLPTMLSPDRTQIAYFREGFDRCDPGRWRPSIHMPRWASRITLEVTGVRIERLQDISQEDAIAEGMRPDPGIVGDDDIMVHEVMLALSPGLLEMNAPRARYVLLWDSINGGKPGAANWNANPWVWVVEFKRVKP